MAASTSSDREATPVADEERDVQQVSRSDSESDEGDAPVPDEAFEDAAQDELSDDDDSSSESDSEDIIVGRRTSQHEPTVTPQPRLLVTSSDDPPAESSSPLPNSDLDEEDERETNDSSSDLSDLGATPEPPDPELLRLVQEQRTRKLDLCECEGWCSCEKYKIFYGFGHQEQSSDADDASSTETGQKNETPAEEQTVSKAASEADAEDKDDEDVPANPSSSQKDDASDSANNKQAEAPEASEDFDSDSEFPSQTHLSERVLASEEFPESSMRSTINKGKRANNFEEESAVKKTRTDQVFSWDRIKKPSRAPAGWAGGKWE